jgi:predicted ArsR family transcriptional regulator
MAPDLMEEVLSSRAKLRVLDALSVRPRTLVELSDVAGISVQGVLRHLRRLSELGMVEERSLSRVSPKARLVYSATSSRIRDYSTPGFAVVRATAAVPGAGGARVRDLERAAGEQLILRRRIKEAARKLGRMIDDAADQSDDLEAAMDGLPLSREERLMVGVVLTEDTMEDGVKVLSRYYGLDDRRSIDKALAKAKRNVSK